MGAVATTFIAGVEAIRKRPRRKPIGSLTQMGTVRLGKRTDNRSPAHQGLRARWPSSTTSSSAAGTSITDNAYEAARKAGVLDNEHLAALKPLPGDDQALAGGLRPAVREEARTATNVKKGKNKRDLADQVTADIEQLQEGQRPRRGW